MQRKHGKDNLAILSVHLDALEEKDLKKLVLAKLSGAGASFPSVILAEDSELWSKKLRAVGYPFVYVFNREGKWLLFRSDDSQYKEPEDMLAAVDTAVETFLMKK